MHVYIDDLRYDPEEFDESAIYAIAIDGLTGHASEPEAVIESPKEKELPIEKETEKLLPEFSNTVGRKG